MHIDPRSTPRIHRSFKAINGLRGPGAILIAFAHLAVVMNLLAYRHVAAIAVVVDMFFVFSGIVIAHAYADRLSRASAVPDYILRRIGRIWPVQATMLMVLVVYECAKALAALLFGSQFSHIAFDPNSGALARAIPSNLFLVHALGIHDRETWNFPSWSVSVEFAVYLLFALFCMVRPPLRHVLSVVVIFLALLLLALVAPYHMRSTFDFGILRCIAGFLAGTLCREVAIRWRIPAYPFPTIVEFALLGLFALWAALSVGTYAVYAAPFVISVTLMGLVAERGAVSRILVSKPLQVLAELSFSIYMVHAVVLIFLLAGLHLIGHAFHLQLFATVENPLVGRPGASDMVEVLRLHSLPAIAGLIVVYGVAVAAVTLVVHRLVEVPGRAAFARMADRLQRRTARLAADAQQVLP